MQPDRKTIAVLSLVIVAALVLGWGIYSSMARSLSEDRGPRRAANNPELRALMESQRQERDEWMVRFSQAAPNERRAMLIQHHAEMEERRAEWQTRREQMPEGERPPRPEGQERPEGRPDMRNTSPEDRAERIAGGNPQRQALRHEMRRTMRDNGLEPPGRRPGGGGPRRDGSG